MIDEQAIVGSQAFPLAGSQRAALARVHHAIGNLAGVAVLCGPAGCGKSTVLSRLRSLPGGGGTVRIVDDAHLLDDTTIGGICDEAAASAASGPPLVLAGRGRLLTLVARNSRMEAMVSLRATIHPMTRDETRLLATAVIGEGLATPPDIDPGSLDTLHEIACGMPRAVVSLARFARLMLEATPTLRLEPEHVEMIHRRLSTTAA